jgi:hypothetical protein
MSNAEERVPDGERRPKIAPTTTIWRYLGDRDTADRAYCIRFGVQEAPEPTEFGSGVWSYAVPATTQRT